MTHRRQPYDDPAQTQNDDRVTELKEKLSSSIEGSKSNGRDTEDRLSPFLRFGPSWAEIRQEWQDGSRAKVIVWFAVVSLFGWCLGQGISKMI
ncbi:hypothetical protein N7481_003751 [Penicillium waksmanii]|uniref:uncharacterized protein n=1 Tax=Penicillium waksmanii TaxID=69791 RepID=UPI002548C482|nr:uncharacterized protein N7481_003751 [Penicillium waksmanii]KAJ5988541.1 hypothetical protein N7481_003751 [Penicillium waksmanii]